MKKRNIRQMDMLSGSLLGKIMLFALPLAASSILQQLFNSADIAVAGKFAGVEAQAAVGVNGPVINLLINLFVGLSVGANVLIANLIGQDKVKEVREAVHTVISLSLISGFALLFIGQFAAAPMLRLIDTPETTLNQAVLYLRIYFLGMPFIMFYNFGSAILRSIGDTRRPMYCLVLSGILNVILNLILVKGFGRGADGVAIATAVSNVVSAAILLYFLMHAEDIIRFNPRRLSLVKSHVVQIVKIGVPAGIQGMVFSLSNTCIQSAINGFGDSAIAGCTSANNYESYTYFVTSAFSQAVITFTSQNYGAGKLDRCKRVHYMGMGTALAITVTMCAVFVLFRVPLIRIFTSDPTATDFALRRMVNVEILEFMPVIYEVAAASMRGFGYSMMPALVTLVGTCGLRFAWVYTVFERFNSFEMLMRVYPVTWLITGTSMVVMYYIIRRKAFAKKAAGIG